jgi:hypothetical protein
MLGWAKSPPLIFYWVSVMVGSQEMELNELKIMKQVETLFLQIMQIYFISCYPLPIYNQILPYAKFAQ